MSETLSAERYPIEIIQGVEGLCIGLNNYRLVGPKPWGGGTVVKRWHVSLAELGKAIPEVATIEALQRERDFLSCLVAEWESAAMRSLLAYIEDIKPSKAILEEMAQTSKAIREAVEDHPWIKVAAKRYREYQPGEAGHHQRRAALEMKS